MLVHLSELRTIVFRQGERSWFLSQLGLPTVASLDSGTVLGCIVLRSHTPRLDNRFETPQCLLLDLRVPGISDVLGSVVLALSLRPRIVVFLDSVCRDVEALAGAVGREPTTEVEYFHARHPSFTVELFIKGDDDVRSRVLDADGELQRPPLEEGETYHSPTVFQLKAMLFHAGILTERGSEPSNLTPTDDVWALRDQI